jgi:VanW like protein
MTLDHARRAQRPAAVGVDPGWRDAAETMPIVRTTPERRSPRRARTAILAALAVVVCGAATIEVALARPTEHVPAAAAVGVAAAAPPATRSAAASTPSAPVASVPPPTASGFAMVSMGGPSPSPTATGGAGPAVSLEPDLVLLGSWTVAYVVGPANGQGANVVIPLRHLDGLVIKPGTTFDFWTAVGEVSRRTGYRRGAIIVGHHVDPDGALAGGICTVSTAIFDAAARAGLPITARTSHGGYLAKYPLGLDAAVAKGDHRRQTLAFRNDSTEPIVIRTVSVAGIARVDLYGREELGRKVEFSAPVITHRRSAHDRHIRTRSLRRGEHRRVQDRSDGMTVVVTRTVRATDGHLIRRDRWTSVYRWLDGLVLDGTA